MKLREIRKLERPSKKVQKTNLFTVYTRSFSDIPHSKELSEILGAEAAFKQTRSLEDIKVLVPYFESRYKATDALILREGVNQVVEFAAGRTVRGINNPQWTYFHTDQDTNALRQMKSIISKLLDGEERQNIHFINYDAISGNGSEKILELLSRMKTAVVHEGLFRYYPNEVNAKIAYNAQVFLRQNGGVYITPDIRIQEDIDLVRGIGPGMKKAHLEQERELKRDLSSSVFKTRQEAIDFFSNLGFSKIEIYEHGDLVPDLYSLNVFFPTGRERNLVEKATKSRKIWKMNLTLDIA